MAFLDETGLAELWALVKAEDVKNAVIATTSYTGTNVYGSGNKNSLTFNFVPKIVFIFRSDVSETEYARGVCLGVLFPLVGKGISLEGGNYAQYDGLIVSVSGNTVSWYNGSGADHQLNANNVTYMVAAIG